LGEQRVFDFHGRVVLVTGAASGIGKSIATAFGRAGASVMAADANEKAVQALEGELLDAGMDIAHVVTDVSDPSACEHMVSECMRRFGGLHIAVNNAAVPTRPYVDFESLEIEDWHRALGVNLTGVFQSMKAEVPALKASGGAAIINVASMMSSKAAPGQAAYIASKHGVAGLTKAASLDLIKHGIRVNAICPGFVDTPMLAPALADDATRSLIEAMIPAGLPARPEEIASVALFLGSDLSSYLVGALLPVDGGATL
jgi:NAD(P)-dependent dehydrogenase (short-subunit alcohol dehydrogenase family)